MESNPSRLESNIAVLLAEVADQNSESIEMFISGVLQNKPQRFSHEQLTHFSSNFTHQVGRGGFANVYKGHIGAVEVVIKVLKVELNFFMEKQFMAELGAISKVSHINIIKLIGFCFDDKVKAFVYEYMENGSLGEVLNAKHSAVSWEKLYGIVVGTAKGLSYLHEQCNEGIIHCDLSPSNVLLDKDYTPKVANFGYAEFYKRDVSEVTLSNRLGGMGAYDAPEVRLGMQKLTNKCDVFSFGMLLFEVLNRRDYGGESGDHQFFPRKVWDKFEQGGLDELTKDCGIEDKDKESGKTLAIVALWCTQYMPEDRPPMSTVVKVLEMEIQLPLPPKPFLVDVVSSSTDNILKASDSTTNPTPSSASRV